MDLVTFTEEIYNGKILFFEVILVRCTFLNYTMSLFLQAETVIIWIIDVKFQFHCLFHVNLTFFFAMNFLLKLCETL